MIFLGYIVVSAVFTIILMFLIDILVTQFSEKREALIFFCATVIVQLCFAVYYLYQELQRVSPT